jgi:hypothetical protein
MPSGGRGLGSVIAVEEIVFPQSVVVRRWADPVVDRVGFVVLDVYVELVWLPVIGPSATWMLRRLDGWLPDPGWPVEIDLSELGEMLGLGASVATGSSLQRTMRRLVRFGLADWSGKLRVRDAVPPLPHRQPARLPQWVQDAHAALVAARLAALRDIVASQLLPASQRAVAGRCGMCRGGPLGPVPSGSGEIE